LLPNALFAQTTGRLARFKRGRTRTMMNVSRKILRIYFLMLAIFLDNYGVTTPQTLAIESRRIPLGTMLAFRRRCVAALARRTSQRNHSGST
jgi:hypothetical protein